LKATEFPFFLVPASEPFVDCEPAKCERSQNGIPYPRLRQFAQSVLDTQRYADLEDLVDGMNLDFTWGEENLDLNRIPVDYINLKNQQIQESLPGLAGIMASLSTAPNARKAWASAVQGKRARMVPKYPETAYSTRFRLIGSADPRQNERRVA